MCLAALLGSVLGTFLTTHHPELCSCVLCHTPNPDCPSGEPCLTINEYAQGNHFDGDDNITLLFQNGEHNLSAHNLEIAHRDKLEMMYNFQGEVSAIQLLNMTCTKIENISSVTVTKLNFQVSNYCSRDCLSTSDVSCQYKEKCLPQLTVYMKLKEYC